MDFAVLYAACSAPCLVHDSVKRQSDDDDTLEEILCRYNIQLSANFRDQDYHVFGPIRMLYTNKSTAPINYVATRILIDHWKIYLPFPHHKRELDLLQRAPRGPVIFIKIDSTTLSSLALPELLRMWHMLFIHNGPYTQMQQPPHITAWTDWYVRASLDQDFATRIARTWNKDPGPYTAGTEERVLITLIGGFFRHMYSLHAVDHVNNVQTIKTE